MIPPIPTNTEEQTTVVLTGLQEAGHIVGQILNKLISTLGSIYLIPHVTLLGFLIACAIIVMIEDVLFIRIGADWDDHEDDDHGVY